MRSTRRQPRTMRSTCSAVPARPTASRRSSASGVATRVSARTFEYDSSPRASAWASNGKVPRARDRKSTRLNSSHSQISYAVFCLKKKKKQHTHAHSTPTKSAYSTSTYSSDSWLSTDPPHHTHSSTNATCITACYSDNNDTTTSNH